MSSESWVGVAAIIVTVLGALGGAFLAWMSAMWLEVKALALGVAEFKAMMKERLDNQEAHLEHNDKRLDRHSVRLDDLETAVWKEGPRSSRILKKPIKVDEDDSDSDNLKES